MAFNDRITTSLFGRRLGLQFMSTTVTGGSRGGQEFLVGAEAVRADATTADTTSTNLHPFGVSFLASGTSAVYTIDPPIPGVRKTIISTTEGPAFVKTANNETFVGASTVGSSFTTIKLSSNGASLELVGVTTAVWAAVLGGSTSLYTLTTST